MDSSLVDSVVMKKQQQLQRRFQGAVSFLKKTFLPGAARKNTYLSTLPWCFLIGPAGAGKTTLLARSGLRYILSKKFQEDSIPPSEDCHWWVTRQAVLVDVPGSYIASNRVSRALFRHVLSLMTGSAHKKKLNSIVLAVHLPALMKKERSEERNKVVAHLRKRLIELREVWGPLPIHLVVTQCDLLLGFSEFFSESDRDDIAEPWGVTLSALEDNQKIESVFSEQFDLLIQQLNKQLIWRLHQERSVDARVRIKEFPVQVEKLKRFIVRFLEALSLPELPLQSVYLTSATQDTKQEKSSEPLVNDAALPMIASLVFPVAPNRAYFTRQLILHRFVVKTIIGRGLTKDPLWWRRRIAIGVAATVILLASLFLGYDFNQSVHDVREMKRDVVHYQASLQIAEAEGSRTLKILPLLNTLWADIHRVDTHPLVLALYSRQSNKTASILYEKALRTMLLPDIKNTFEHYLKTAKSQSPEQVYTMLEAYLMLGDKTHCDADVIVARLQILMNDSASRALVGLSDHIQNAVFSSSTPIGLDSALIADVRAELNALPGNTLGFLLLKNKNSTAQSLDLDADWGQPPVFMSEGIATHIPAMFTAKRFDPIVDTEVNDVAEVALEGNWVLGIHPMQQASSAVAALASQLRIQYIANYVDLWENLIDNIHLSFAHDLVELDAMLGVLIGDHSPLLQLLATIKENTVLAPVMAASPKLKRLDALLTADTHADASSASLYTIFIGLHDLQNYLDQILKAPNIKEAAADAITKRMHHFRQKGAPNDDPISSIYLLAEVSPQPMKSWLHLMASDAWRLMMAASA